MSPHLIGLRWNSKSLLWPASGSGLETSWPYNVFGVSAQAYHVWAHFKALDEGDLVTPFKILEIFFISSFPAGSEEILLPLSMCIECLQANVKKWSSGKWKPCQDQ